MYSTVKEVEKAFFDKFYIEEVNIENNWTVIYLEKKYTPKGISPQSFRIKIKNWTVS